MHLVQRSGDHFLQIGEVHRLDPQVVVEEGWQGFFEAAEHGEIILAQADDHLAGDAGPQQRGDVGDEGSLLFRGAEDEQFLELVEDQVYRPQVIEIQGLDRRLQPLGLRDRGEGAGGDFLPQGLVDVAVAADEDRQPVRTPESIGQTALDQAGLARSLRPVHQGDAGLQDHGV